MTRWSFLWTPRWLGYLSLVLVFAVVCSLLGAWQFARRGEAQLEISRIDANYDGTARDIRVALPTLDAFDENDKWSKVRITGEYLASESMLVRGRPYGGHSGFEVLVPLRTTDGSIFIVDRGWIPLAEDGRSPTTVPSPPNGTVTVIARLKAGEAEISGRTTVAGTNQLATIHLPEIADRLGKPTYVGAYGLLVSEDPSVGESPLPSVRPVRDEGPHLSYALQWYVFALLGFIGYGWAIRHEYRVLNSDDPAVRAAAEERERRRAAKRPSDADVEDARKVLAEP
ncbi:MAG TPA: SURF1 family protein, partial [Terrimesophilobacter sp.]|nr:SURF1 family protein [Terrimesophilobacter sp.]